MRDYKLQFPLRKTAKTVKEYKTRFHGVEIIVPAGSTVSNQTACGYDDNYRFWTDYRNQKLGGLVDWDLLHYGLNIPAEYCEQYK